MIFFTCDHDSRYVCLVECCQDRSRLDLQFVLQEHQPQEHGALLENFTGR